jgi:hypothetical protein
MCHIVFCIIFRSALIFHIIHKRYDFRKMVLNIKCEFRFSLQRLSGTFLIVDRTEEDMIKHVYLSSCKRPLSFTSLTELEFSIEIFEMYLNVKFRDNASGIQYVPFGQTRQTLTDVFHIFANGPIAAITTLWNINTFVFVKNRDCEVKNYQINIW